MVRDALIAEIDRDIEIAMGTQQLIHDRRDMLQGDAKRRVVFSMFHTDVWDALVHDGALNEVGADPAAVSRAYSGMKEINELIGAFRAEGDSIVFLPTRHNPGEPYGRQRLIEAIEERCGAIIGDLEAARDELHDA